MRQHRANEKNGAEKIRLDLPSDLCRRQFLDRLFNRTTRSVGLTSQGAALLSGVAPLIAQLDDALALVGRSGVVSGELRINASLSAASYLLAEVVPGFSARHPDIRLDLRHEERLVDIVAEGCDAGIRLCRTVPGDMIGVPFGEPLRFLPIASPAYLDRHGVPLHPRDLLDHRCIRTRLPRGDHYSWEFVRDGQEHAIDVPGVLTLDRMTLMIEAAIAGMGIAFVLERAVTSQIAAGALQPLLTEWCPADERYMLYYPGRRHVLPPLRALIDHLTQARTAT